MTGAGVETTCCLLSRTPGTQLEEMVCYGNLLAAALLHSHCPVAPHSWSNCHSDLLCSPPLPGTNSHLWNKKSNRITVVQV